MNELWINHYSVESWNEPKIWTSFFDQAQKVLGAPITHLDDNDPVKRKVTSLDGAGDFVCAFGRYEDSRWILGKFKSLGIDFSIQQYHQHDRWPNLLLWYVPLSFMAKKDSHQRIKTLFDLGNRTLKSFYAYSDELVQIERKKKASGAIDIETELPGFFWLTYFNATYASFFGNERFRMLPGIVEHANDGSSTVILGENPKTVTGEFRERSEEIFGKSSFVDPNGTLRKKRGQFVLSFEQILG